MHHLLLIDDDEELCELLTEYLEPEGFQVEAIHDGVEGIKHCRLNTFDIVILDVMLPNLNGFDVLRQIRETQEIPIIMLTARGEEVDRIVGIEMGADDYLPKPCSPRELLARIRGVLRRVEKPNAETPKELRIDDVMLDKCTRTAVCKGVVLELTAAEFNILEVLLLNAGRVVTKEVLTEKGLSRDMTRYDRSIDVHISKLRTKLGKDNYGKSRIRTIRGVGYLYETDPWVASDDGSIDETASTQDDR